MVNLYDCPKCGRKESAFGDGFCGTCERAYAEEMERYHEEEIARLNEQIRTCTCAEGTCTKCTYALAGILSHQGREADAVALINQ